MHRMFMLIMVVVCVPFSARAEAPLSAELTPVMRQAQELFQQRKYEEVIRILATYSGADHPVRHLLIGHAQSRLDHWRDAISAYQTALAQDGEYRPAGIALAQAYARDKQWPQVLPLAGRFINPEKDKAEELVFYAQAAYYTGDKRLCRQLTHRCMERFPLDRRCRQMDLILLLENKVWSEAAQAALQLLDETPTETQLWNQYACAAQSGGQAAESPAALEAAWLCNPASPENRLTYFSSQLAAGHVSRVIADGERLLRESTPNMPKLTEDLALLDVLLHAADIDGDDYRVTQWLALVPREKQSRDMLIIAARSALRRNDRSAAREALRLLIEHGQARAAEFLWSARIAEEADDLAAAETDYRQAMRLGGRDVRLAHLHLARLLWSMKRYEQARTILGSYLEKYPEDAAARSMQLVFK